MDIFSFEGYIFDLDGTLLDSMGLWDDIYVKVLGDFNIKAPSDYLFNVNHMSLCDGAAYTIERFRLEGVVKKEEIADLKKAAQFFGGQVGCSRPVFMDGLLGAESLIGMSGHLCSPSCCLTIGVSGAAAFLAGIQKSRKIIAVNTDEKAPIFSCCDIGIIGDGREILDELLKRLEDENNEME